MRRKSLAEVRAALVKQLELIGLHWVRHRETLTFQVTWASVRDVSGARQVFASLHDCVHITSSVAWQRAKLTPAFPTVYSGFDKWRANSNNNNASIVLLTEGANKNASILFLIIRWKRVKVCSLRVPLGYIINYKPWSLLDETTSTHCGLNVFIKTIETH